MKLRPMLAVVLAAVTAFTAAQGEPPRNLPPRPPANSPSISPAPTPAHKSSNEPTFRVQPQESPSVAEIDEAVGAVMKLNGVRGAALAIVKGTRLVYARGYTWAPSDYRDVLPTTFFRQASVSKTFAAIATYQLLQEGKVDGTFTLDTTMQSVLHLKTPEGREPVDPNFNKITIRHLLEMTAGVDPAVDDRDLEVAKAFTRLPVTPAQIASYCAALKLKGMPGSKSIATYSNGGYFMLSQVVARMRRARTFEAALTAPLLKPLDITRVREARSLIGAQLPDEARYHPDALSAPKSARRTVRSVMSPEQPMVMLGYGEANLENYDGSGGLSAAVTDVARVLAALSLRENNPMLDDAGITGMLANAAAASSDRELTRDSNGKAKAWGFHGFDAVTTMDVANGLYRGHKGGDLSTSQNAIYFERGGISYVICWNGKVPHPELPFYPRFQKVLDVAREHDWGNTDLFPEYGMPSFPSEPQAQRQSSSSRTSIVP
jgi:CubicO group peptidase (beta-lactamase class C family)